MSGQIIARLHFPLAVPRGITTVLLAILFFGSLNLFALSIIGEYIAKVFEEVNQRPHFLAAVSFATVRSVPPLWPRKNRGNVVATTNYPGGASLTLYDVLGFPPIYKAAQAMLARGVARRSGELTP